MTDKDFDSLKIDNIVMTANSDIVFIQCHNQDDAAQLTSRAKNLPRDSGTDTPRIMMYMDRRAMKRHKAILNMAKTIRDHADNTIQTSIRTGKNDFLLRKRTKGDNTPWQEIPPIRITQEIPNFEVGNYRDIVNPENNAEDDPQDKPQDDPLADNHIEGIEDVLMDFQEQEKQTNKRERPNETNSSHLNEKISNMRQDNKTPDNSDNEDTDENEKETNRTKQNLNSTTDITKNNKIEHYFAATETPLPVLQPKGRFSCLSIPDTPESKTKVEQTNNKNKRNDKENDDELIQELMKTKENKNKNTDNE